MRAIRSRRSLQKEQKRNLLFFVAKQSICKENLRANSQPWAYLYCISNVVIVYERYLWGGGEQDTLGATRASLNRSEQLSISAHTMGRGETSQ